MEQKKRVLIVEDEKSIVDILRFNLEKEGYAALTAYDGEAGLDQALKENPDLILLDVMLPKMNGFDVCRILREKGSSVPVIILTAREEETDKVLGLEIGADDYITKPFSLAILRARVNARLRGPQQERRSKGFCYRTDDYLFDFEKMRFFHSGNVINLSKTEQKLLRILTENAGITLPRSRLIDYVWTEDSDFVDENALSVSVKRLRDKLEAQNAIETVYGIGYRWKA